MEVPLRRKTKIFHVYIKTEIFQIVLYKPKREISEKQFYIFISKNLR